MRINYFSVTFGFSVKILAGFQLLASMVKLSTSGICFCLLSLLRIGLLKAALIIINYCKVIEYIT